MSQWNQVRALRDQLANETGSTFSEGGPRIVLLYPSPYRVGMSSLGYQWILKVLQDTGFSVERAFLPEDVSAWKASRTPLLTLETQSPVGEFNVVGISLAYELELAGMVQALELSGIPPRREDRTSQHPRILLGGPLTFSNPLPAAPLVDAMLLGEAEEVVVPAMEAACHASREEFLDTLQSLDGGYVPERHGTHLPDVAKATDALLPARSHIISPAAELSNMWLVEGERGCHRTCTFCVMRRSTNGGMRLVDPERILNLIPDHAPKVGLVGAAISDHPRLVDLLDVLVEQGRGLGISSLRADQVARKPRIAELLRIGGYRTLTVASDAASQRLRRAISKGTVERHLLACAQLAAEHKYSVLKIYMMLGVPEETEEDIDELIRFTRELAAIHPVALGIAPFVPKRNTPLDTARFAGIPVVERRLQQLRRGLAGAAEVRPTSARWAWVETELAQGGPAWGDAVIEAVAAGGNFSAYKRAFKKLDPAERGPWRLAAHP